MRRLMLVAVVLIACSWSPAHAQNAARRAVQKRPVQTVSYDSLDKHEKVYVDATVQYQENVVPVLQEMIRDLDKDIASKRQNIRQLRGDAYILRVQDIQEIAKQRNELQQKMGKLKLQRSRGEAPDTIIDPVWTMPSIGAAGTCAYSTKVRQVVSSNEILCEIVGAQDGHDLVYIEGMSTYGLTDGMAIKLPPVVFVGTKTYTTAMGGSNTVFVGVTVETDKLKPLIRQKVREAYPPQVAQTLPAAPQQASK